MVGGACSVAAVVGGLALTSMAPDEAVASMPALSYETLHQSFLFSLLNELALGPPSGLASATEVHLHPLAIVGFTGLISNAVALLPCGRLDGGRLAVAAYGRRPAAALSGLCLVVLGLATLVSDEPQFLSFWALVVMLLFRQPEVPCINEVSPLDDARSRLLLPLLACSLLVLLPAPHFVPEYFDQDALRSMVFPIS
uniref:Uncharacterized protein n=1 Tax=Haptolina ericina TaxID=156174 RepID=A0A7S3EZP4_9EUKA